MERTEITAGRLHLRPWEAGDAGQVEAICQDPVIQRWTSVPVPYTRADAEGYVGPVTADGWDDGTAAHFAVLDAVSADVLASISLIGIADGRAELGLWVAAAARGRHVGSDAAGAVCRWGFAALGLRRVQWLADVGNTASIACALRSGFVAEGVLRQRLDAHPGPEPRSGPMSGGADAWVGSRLPTD